MNCQECEKYPALYAINKVLPNGEKIWLQVCPNCDHNLGRDNLKRSGGHLTREKLDELRKGGG